MLLSEIAKGAKNGREKLSFLASDELAARELLLLGRESIHRVLVGYCRLSG